LLRVHGLFFLCALCLPSLNAAADSTVAAHPPSKTSQVVIVHDPRAVDAFRAQPEIVQAMVNCGITNLTGTATVRDAWRKIVSPQDVVGIKVFSTPGPNSGTRPSVVAGVVEGLLAGGVSAKHIVVWDRSLGDLKLAGFSDLSKR